MNRHHKTRDPIGWDPEEASHMYWNPETGKVEDDRIIPVTGTGGIAAPVEIPVSEAQDPRAPYRQLLVIGQLHIFEAPWVNGIEIRRGQDSVPIAFSELVDLIITLEDAKEWRPV